MIVFEDNTRRVVYVGHTIGTKYNGQVLSQMNLIMAKQSYLSVG